MATSPAGRRPAQVPERCGAGATAACCQRGFDVGEIDGVTGASTRQAIRAIQLKYALPADG